MSFSVEERRVRKREWLAVALVAVACVVTFNVIQGAQSSEQRRRDAAPAGSSSVIAAPKDVKLHITTAEKLWQDFVAPDGRALMLRENPVRITGRISNVFGMRRVVALETGTEGTIECHFNAIEPMDGLESGQQVTLEGLLKGNTEEGIFVQNVVVVASP